MAGTITVKHLADRASIKPTQLRKILRQQFPRKDKGKNYSWQPDDPQIELILKAVKNQKVVGSNPTPATKEFEGHRVLSSVPFLLADPVSRHGAPSGARGGAAIEGIDKVGKMGYGCTYRNDIKPYKN